MKAYHMLDYSGLFDGISDSVMLMTGYWIMYIIGVIFMIMISIYSVLKIIKFFRFFIETVKFWWRDAIGKNTTEEEKIE